MRFHPPKPRAALTMLELLVVLVILVAMAGLLVPLLAGAADQTRLTTTQANMQRLRDAISGAPDHPGYLADTGRMPRTIQDLFDVPTDDIVYLPPALQSWDPIVKRGWRGPYLLDPGGRFDWNGDTILDPAVLDGWAQPIVLQIPSTGANQAENEQFARVVSAGPDGEINTPAALLMPGATTRGDDIVLFLRVADQP